MMDEHRNHDTVSAADQRTEKQVFNIKHQVNTQCSDPIVFLYLILNYEETTVSVKLYGSVSFTFIILTHAS